MAEQIINGAPLHISRGTQDKSTRPLVRDPEAIPSHLPKFFVYAEKGPSGPQLVVGDSRISTFGERTWDLLDKYANHATVFANAANAEGNQCMIQRIMPADSGPEANLLISVDFIKKDVPVYERNTDGTLKLVPDSVNPQTLVPVDTGAVVDGYELKFVTTSTNSKTNLNNPTTGFGVRARTVGSMTWTDGSAVVHQSQLFPLIEVKASSVGEVFNNAGVRVWAPTAKSDTPINQRMMQLTKAYPFSLQLIRRNPTTSVSKIVENNFSEQTTNFVFKEGAIYSATGEQLFLGDVFPGKYQNINDPRFPAQYADVGTVKIYQNNIDELLALLVEAEIDALASIVDPLAIDNGNDFEGISAAQVDEYKYMFNLFEGLNSGGTPYQATQFATGGVRFSKNTDMLMSGSSDGTMNDTLFADLVGQEMDEYLNTQSRLMETAVNVESVIYDSGFPIETKKKLCNIIGIRKDTLVMLSCHDATRRATPTERLSAGQDYSVAMSLKAFISNFPESDYFGTPVMRGLVMGRSGFIRNSVWKQEVPALFEVLKKNCRYMGAGDGNWKPGFSIDGAPNSIVETLFNLSETFTPATARNRDWDVGLNWIQAYDRSSFFIPALKTVYDNDTSVLNNMYTVFCIAEINKVCQRAWREFSGVGNKTNAQMAKDVDDFILSKASPNRFDNRYVIDPATYFTDGDIARGYSWTTPVKIYANPMRTVMVSSVHAYRMSDFVASA